MWKAFWGFVTVVGLANLGIGFVTGDLMSVVIGAVDTAGGGFLFYTEHTE